jgi:type IV secretory pathway VirB2 component (pilin)
MLAADVQVLAAPVSGHIESVPAQPEGWGADLIALTRLEAMLLANVAIALAVIAVAMIGIVIVADRARTP